MANWRNVRLRQDLDRRAYVKHEDRMLEHGNAAIKNRYGWRDFGFYPLPQPFRRANVLTFGSSGGRLAGA